MLTSASSLRDQYATLQQQTTTGLVSQSYSGLAASAVSQVMNLTALSDQNNAYTQAITQAQGKASVMQTALSQISTLVSAVASNALGITASSPASAVSSLNQQASQALSQLVSALNTNYEGDYVFSGTNTSVAPATPGSPPSFSTATPVNVQIGSSNSVTLGLSTAGSAAINTIMTTLAGLATATASTMQTIAAPLSSAGTTLSQESGQIGLTQNAMTAASTSYASMQTLLASQISDLTNVDMATAISHMQAVNTQLQASYQVLGQMSKLNLASYL
jgi:flagellar hook-associated protein 3 FlgL